MPAPALPADWDRLRGQLTAASQLLLDLPPESPYGSDATGLRALPVAVVEVATIEDMVATVKFAGEHALGITSRGAGSGLSGGAVPSPNSIVISCARLTSCTIDRERQLAFCGSGLITQELQQQALAVGLAYPPDPASQSESTIGGNIAEGAGGLRCRRFGVTKDYVEGIIAVTGDGQILRTGCYNQFAAFSQSDVLIASEGTLAVIAEVAVRLIPPPSSGATMLALFHTVRAAGEAVAAINAAGIIPTVMEFLDAGAIRCVNQSAGSELVQEAGALLLLQAGVGEADGRDIQAICESKGAFSITVETIPQRAETLWTVRRGLSRAVKKTAPHWLSEDVAVPNRRFPDLVEFVASLNDGSPVNLLSFGHAGDGNLHAVFLWENDDPDTRRHLKRKIDQLMEKTLSYGGTLTGEHGIGLVKKEYLSAEFDPPTLAAMRLVKQIYDEAYRLNADKIF